MRTGIFSVLIALLSLYAPAFAYDWSTNPGDGSPENPYQIRSADDWLILMATPTSWNKHFVLTANIDLAELSLTPVGTNSAFPFVGNLNGNGYTISNAALHQPANDCVGLFGFIGSGGQVTHLGILNVSVQANNYLKLTD
ncbi:MAG: hypothetical protein LLF76_07530 [Planctomycetaceae bacterium]|nr:hypothetical protein [Planctomycetaceae bacterium]